MLLGMYAEPTLCPRAGLPFGDDRYAGTWWEIKEGALGDPEQIMSSRLLRIGFLRL